MGAAEPAAAPPQARHPLVERVLAPGAPEVLRLGAARGALPFPLLDLLFVQIHLASDPSAAVADAARDSLARVSEDAILPLLRDPACDPVLLDHFARSGRLKGETLALALTHPAITDAALLAIASGSDPDALALIVTNEVRLIASPALMSALMNNQHLRPDGRRRLQELEHDFVGKTPLRVVAPEPAAPAAAVTAGAGAPPVSETAPDQAGAPETEAGEPPPEYDPLLEQQAEEELQKTDAFQRIMRMNVAERQLLAMKGNSEERAILIRDTARMVSQSVLKNPRISETEIVVFAAMRNVHEDILRSIASNREWTKAYAVAHALVRNPKTPPGLSIQFLGRLGTRDLKIAAGDKNVPELVRRNARNLFIARTQPPKKGSKKAH